MKRGNDSGKDLPASTTVRNLQSGPLVVSTAKPHEIAYLWAMKILVRDLSRRLELIFFISSSSV
jgi:hypothetical protein